MNARSAVARSSAISRAAACSLVLAVLLPAQPVLAQPAVSGCGTISGNVVWNPGTIYVLDRCGLTIPVGASLTIAAGTIVKLAGSHDMIAIDGALILAGSATAPVVLTSLRDDSAGGDTNGDGMATAPAPGDWGWVLFNPGSSGTIEHSDIAFGGVGYHGYTHWAMVKVYGPADVSIHQSTLRQSWNDGLYAENASLAVSASRIAGNRAYGLNCEGLDSQRALEIADNVFETTVAGSSAARIRFLQNPALAAVLRNTASGFGTNGIVLEGNIGNDLDLNGDLGLPFLIPTGLTVAPSATVTVSPGAVFKLSGCGAKVVVEGSLLARGTDAEPIVLTSLRDDSIAGDTNGDGATSVAAPGDWGYVRFSAGSSGSWEHATLRYGGVACSGYDSYSMLQVYAASVTLDHSTLAMAWGNGLFAENASVAVRDSRIVDVGQNAASAGLHYNGLDPTLDLEIRNTVFETRSTLQTAARITLGDHPPRIQLQHNVASGGGRNGIVLSGTVQRDLRLDAADSLPFIIDGWVRVADAATLSLSPGTTFKLTGCGRKINVDGTLVAAGTFDDSIVFTSLADDARGGDTNGDGDTTLPHASDWGYVGFAPGSKGTLEHVFLGYGGVGCSGYDLYTLLAADNAVVDVSHAAFDAYRWNAVHSYEARLRIMQSRFLNDLPDQPMAIRNAGRTLWVDARQNWWGDASGPYHPTRNPDGTGAPVTDLVRFLPWAVDASGGEATQVLVEGPSRASPGDVVEYAVSYYAAEAVENAVLAFVLPRVAYFTDGSAGVLYWPRQHTAIWKLGNLSAGQEGKVLARLSYAWGVPNGMIGGGFAQLAGTNTASGILDYQSLLDYTPPKVVSEEALSAAGLAAERSANAELNAQCRAAEAAGAVLGHAYRYRREDGQELVEIAYLQPAERAARFVIRAGDDVISMTYDAAGLKMQDSTRGVTLDPASLVLGESGGVGPELRGRGVAPPLFMQRVGECLAEAGVGVTLGTVEKVITALTIPECVTCIVLRRQADCPVCSKKLKDELRLKNLPVVGELIGFVECISQAFGEIGAGFPCTHDLWTCDLNGIRARFYKLIGQDAAMRIPCVVGADGKKHLSFTGTAAGIKQCVGKEICVEGPDDGTGRYGCVVACKKTSSASSAAGFARASESDAACSSFSTNVRAAHDPNLKSGTQGDVTPGQELEYTVEYENLGAGRAYGVYITDELRPHFDEATLDLQGHGEYSPTTRTIFWEIGELAPNGEEGSKGTVTFKVRLKPGLPSGTVITNQAVVYFPSVPEETPTNSVVNLVQPLAAVPQSLETDSSRPIPLLLAGREASGLPLRYSIDVQPLAGKLSGTAPSLTYTPAPNFTGQDRFTFTVGNGVSDSRPAYVTITVHPSPADTIDPEVTWSHPAHGDSLEHVSPYPIFSDATGSLYAPSVIVVFSEAMDPATIHSGSVRLGYRADDDVEASVVWDGAANQAVLTPREAWRDASYTVTVTTEAVDASGNPLASEFVWSFTVEAGARTCPGDCNRDGVVTVDELIVGVNIALGTATAAQCPAMDTSGEGQVTVDELIAAVNMALLGCS